MVPTHPENRVVIRPAEEVVAAAVPALRSRIRAAVDAGARGVVLDHAADRQRV